MTTEFPSISTKSSANLNSNHSPSQNSTSPSTARNDGSSIVSSKSSTITFVDYLKNEGDATSPWFYFLREIKGQAAQCKNKDCMKILKTQGGSTSSLHTHLKSKHQIILKRLTEDEPLDQPGVLEGVQKKKTKINDYYHVRQDNSLHVTISRMVARDGFPFAVFCTSPDLRRALLALNFQNELPKSPTSIGSIVMKFSKSVRNEQRTTIVKKIDAGEKFCAALDEWTSKKNRRFMNIILHGKGTQFWDLGLLRIKGSLTAENALDLVCKKLLCSNVSLESDIISIITDGTSVMTKIGKLTPTHQKLCLAHGVQLAVTDVLYSNNKQPVLEQLNIILDDDEDGITENENESFNSTSDSDEVDVTHEAIAPLIAKVRKLVSLYHNSPLKNENLQSYVIVEFKKEVELIRDSKTRWNSMFDMMERFYLLRSCIKKSIIDLQSTINITLEDWEIDRIHDLIEALGPMKVTVEALCRRDATLLTADAALNFALTKIDQLVSAVAEELVEVFRERIKERRTEYSGVLQYLHTGSYQMKEKYEDVFDIPGKTKVAAIIKSLLSRLNPVEESEENTPTVIADKPHINLEKVQCGKKKSALQIALNQAIEEIDNNAHLEKCQTAPTLLSTIKKEMNLFEGGGDRGHHLQLAYNYLMTIKPTSVEAERAFSSAGYICNKIRSSLRDDTLDELCFLRSHFKLLDG